MSRLGISDETLHATVQAFEEHRTIAATAKALGVQWHTVQRRLSRAAERGLDGSVPHAMPHGRMVKGASTLYAKNPDSGAWEERMVWVKDTHEGHLADAEDAIRDAFAEYKGGAIIPPIPEATDDSLLTLYPIVDHHLGMQAWSQETGGQDYDLSIAQGTLKESLGGLLAQTPPSAEAVILGMGDFTHADNERAETAKSKNRLDVDSRHAKVTRAAVDLLIWSIDAALTKHRRVTVRLLPGNHDPETARMLTICLSLFYSGDDRVVIDTDPGWFWTFQWGVVGLAATHGHNIKPGEMPGTFSAQWPQLWGATRVRRFFFGHIHHGTVGDKHGCKVESFATLAAPDAYHAEYGYATAERSMVAITYHRDRGEFGRVYDTLLPPISGPVARRQALPAR